MTTFTPWPALGGGLLIGLAAALLLLTHGRIAGISGILGGTLSGDRAWRLWFLAGLLGGGALLRLVHPSTFPTAATASPLLLIPAGLLVGFGTRLGNGCTSGHGVCGIGRLSPRSIVATLLFMASGAASVYLLRHVFA